MRLSLTHDCGRAPLARFFEWAQGMLRLPLSGDDANLEKPDADGETPL